MKFFRERTKENIVIMGKNTFKSIGSKPLSDRINIVLTEESDSYQGVLIWNMPLENALRNAKAWFPLLDIYIIGGAYVYNQAIEQSLPDELFLTTMHNEVSADTFIDIEQIKKNYKISHIIDSITEDNKVIGEIVKFKRR
jgi:dihydrofolate reductase